MAGKDKSYRCEDCGRFDDTSVPADCLAGHGNVAFHRMACADFVLKPEKAREAENES
jgi:hypothetical protein